MKKLKFIIKLSKTSLYLQSNASTLALFPIQHSSDIIHPWIVVLIYSALSGRTRERGRGTAIEEERERGRENDVRGGPGRRRGGIGRRRGRVRVGGFGLRLSREREREKGGILIFFERDPMNGCTPSNFRCAYSNSLLIFKRSVLTYLIGSTVTI